MFVDTAKISLPPLPRRLADQQPQHLCLDVNSVKDISFNVFHQQSISGALRQIGKKASKGPDKVGILPLSSRDNIFLSSGEMSISSSEQLKGLPRPWWRRKLSNLAGKNEDTRTREHRIFFPFHPAYPLAEMMERREKARRKHRLLKSSEAKSKARWTSSG